MANTENIEAKLCAYIDGDLDAAGRAEIEKHLAANPQHRGLIEQLARQRDLLRELPRENAPEEIIDALQSQMERSVLLGDADGEHGPETIKISRWPQFMAAAAIVAITVGLGAVIYFVLPQGGGGADYAVVAQPGARLDGEASTIGAEDASGAGTAARATSGSADERGSADRLLAKSSPPAVVRAEGDADPAVNEKETRTSVAAAPAASGALDAMKKPASADPFAPKQMAGAAGAGAAAAGSTSVALRDLQAVQEQLQNAELARQLKDAPGGLADDAVFVVVSTADPNAARSEVTNYLASNKITWDSVAQPVPQLDLAENQAANLSRSQRTNVQMKTGERAKDQAPSGQLAEQTPAAPETTTPQKGEAKSAVTESEQPQEQQDKLAAGEPQRRQREAAARVQTKSGTAAPSGVADAGGAAGGGAGPPAPDSPVMSNASPPNVALQEAAAQAQRELGTPPPEQQLAQQQQQQQPAPQAQQPVTLRTGGSETESRLIIARGMTKQQAQELSTNLSKQTTVQRAAVYDQKAKVAPPQRIMQRSRDFTAAPPATRPSSSYGGGFDTAAAATTAPAGEKSDESPTTAPADGVRKAEELSASGAATPPSGGQQTATPTPTTTTAPAPLPLASQSPSDQAAAAGVPATMPSEALADDQPVDVVILVQDDVPLASQQGEVGQQQQPMPEPATIAPNAAAAPTDVPTAEQAPATQPAP
jgi:anti-sigma factor RsiW